MDHAPDMSGWSGDDAHRRVKALEPVVAKLVQHVAELTTAALKSAEEIERLKKRLQTLECFP